MKKFRRFAVLAFLALGSASMAPVFAASKTPAVETADGTQVGTLTVPDGLKTAEIQRAIVEAAIGRTWTIKSKDDGKVVISLENGRWVAVLTLTYDTKEIQVYSSSTRSGKRAIPEDWIKFIKQDITKALNAKALLK
jgi:hypothetical protein